MMNRLRSWAWDRRFRRRMDRTARRFRQMDPWKVEAELRQVEDAFLAALEEWYERREPSP